MTCLLTNAGRFSIWSWTLIVVALLAFTHAGAPVMATVCASTRAYCPVAYTAGAVRGAVSQTALTDLNNLVYQLLQTPCSFQSLFNQQIQIHVPKGNRQSLVECLDHRDSAAEQIAMQH